MKDRIGFWQEREQYGCFSNFYPCTFTYKGITFNCSEQAFMYEKAMTFNDFETAKQILNETDPKTIKKLGRKVSNFNESKWSAIRYNIMLDINYEKYSQNNELKRVLLSTNNIEIVEDSPFDYIWGIGRDGSGQNLLGKALMKIRDKFRKQIH